MKKIVYSALFIFIFIVTAIYFSPPPVLALNPNHDCSFCHSLHNAPGQTLTNYASSETLCLSCHGAAGSSSLKAEIHKNKDGSSYGTFTVTCVVCHNPHDNLANWKGGTNIKLVGRDIDGNDIAQIATPNSGTRYVTFESRGTDAGEPSLHSFADNDEDGDGYYDGACETCHTLAANHRNNSSGDHSHYTGTNCITCHPHDGYFQGSGGGCLGCHSGTQGPRRAIAGEFSLTSHHVAGGTVTEDDCGVCHNEAHVGTDHMNGVVDLLDPDTGTALTGFTQFTRNTSSDTLESWVVDVQNNFCLKCHDGDGATATNISGNPLRPFSSGARDVPNSFAQFDSTNTFHHAIRGIGNNPYCVPSSSNGNNITMVAPWNQDATHDQISCFDCHGLSGHGGNNQRMLRVAIDFDTMEATASAASLPAGMGATVEDFCTTCHKASVYVSSSDSEAAGSIFEYHGASQSQHGSGGGNELGCMGCHGGVVDFGPPAPNNGAARGNIHGGNFVWPSGTFSAGVNTEHFMLGGWIGGWDTGFDRKGNPIGYCGGGDCNHTGSATKSGQSYTR